MHMLLFKFQTVIGAFLVPAFALPAFAAAPPVQMHVGESFLPARARLVKAGWKPMRIARGDYVISGAETSLAKMRIYEFESCSMSAGSLCIFYYRKRNTCLRVYTIGEEPRVMKVTGSMKECPKPFE